VSASSLKFAGPVNGFLIGGLRYPRCYPQSSSGFGRSEAYKAPAYRTQAIERARQLAPILAELKCSGMSARRMAADMTARNLPTPNGERWHAATVLRALDRLPASG
jgi:hypothetical protein